MDRRAIILLYRNLIKETKKWHAYNYRMYTLRRIRDKFQENKTLQDTNKIKEMYQEGLGDLDTIKRQVTIGNLYMTQPLIIESQNRSRNIS